MPSHIETILNYLHFERRQDTSVFENYINEYINSDKLDQSAKAFLTIQHIRYLQQVNLIYMNLTTDLLKLSMNRMDKSIKQERHILHQQNYVKKVNSFG